MKIKYFFLLISLFYSVLVFSQDNQNLVNLVSSDDRNYYYKLNADSFGSAFELKYFRELVFKNNKIVILDTNNNIKDQLYKTKKTVSWDVLVSELRNMKKLSHTANANMREEEKDNWTTGNLKD
jgi:hypothetical protein